MIHSIAWNRSVASNFDTLFLFMSPPDILMWPRNTIFPVIMVQQIFTSVFWLRGRSATTGQRSRRFTSTKYLHLMPSLFFFHLSSQRANEPEPASRMCLTDVRKWLNFALFFHLSLSLSHPPLSLIFTGTSRHPDVHRAKWAHAVRAGPPFEVEITRSI